MSTTSMVLQNEITVAIRTFVAEAAENRFAADGSQIFLEPLVGFACGDDPIFQKYKEVVGDFHLTPREAMQRHFVDAGTGNPQISDLTVTCWVLPIAKETRLSNRRMKEGPSALWNQTRWYGENFNTCLKRYVVGFLQERGYRAVAPTLTPLFAEHRVASSWSERHMAYAAGLGTFGLHDALITARGVAHRIGSVVLEAALRPTPRPYESHTAYCPFLQNGSCGMCIARCPADAVTSAGHDKLRCRQYIERDLAPWVAARASEGYVGPYAGCGLCMTKVPCEAGIPPSILPPAYRL